MGAHDEFPEQPRVWVPPHSMEAEQGVLGGLMLDNRAFDRVADVVRAEHFYNWDHRAIYSTIAQLVTANKPADVLTVFEAGGHDLPYLNSLVTSVPSAANARAYAQIVLERWRSRQLATIGMDLTAEAMRSGAGGGDATQAVIDRVFAALMALEQRQSESEPQLIADLLGRFIDLLSDRAEGKDDSIRTGLTDLDRLTGGGGRAGELWVIGARPSMGKTAITLTFGRKVGQERVVLMLTQEDSNDMLVARQVAAAGRVNLADIRNPARAPQSMWDGVSEGVELLRGVRLVLDDQASLTLRDVRRKITQTTRRHGKPAMVIVDYLQLMVGEGDNRNQSLGAIANGLKGLAKELGTWIVLLSQLNREADKRPTGPEMQDLRDSGDIEGAADLIGLLFREHMQKPTDANKHHAEFRVRKHKNGPTATLNLFFDGATQRFSDWDGPPPFRSAPGRGYGNGGKGLD